MAFHGGGMPEIEFVAEGGGGAPNQGSNAQHDHWHGVATNDNYRPCKNAREVTLATHRGVPDDILERDLSQLVRQDPMVTPPPDQDQS